MRHKPLILLPVLVAIGILIYSIRRDSALEKSHPGDLRNRVVGARLQMDGITPYFYHWDSTAPVRYYDPSGYNHVAVSNITSTPYLHQLLYPIANLDQRLISRMWLWMQYIALAIAIGIAWKLATKKNQKILVASLGLLYLFTYWWTGNVVQGQNYWLIPLAAFLLFASLLRPDKWWKGSIASILAISLVLIRPTLLLFILPFIVLLPYLTRQFLLSFGLTSILFLTFYLTLTDSIKYWADYRQGMAAHVSMHQGKLPLLPNYEPIEPLSEYEGWIRSQIEQDGQKISYKPSGESGNLFVWIKQITGTSYPVWMNYLLLLSLLPLLLIVFKRKTRSLGYDPLLFFSSVTGLALYMLSDFLSPVHRFAYNGAPWLFLLLLVGSKLDFRQGTLIIFWIILALILISLPSGFIPMQHSIAEYMLLALCIYIVYNPKNFVFEK